MNNRNVIYNGYNLENIPRFTVTGIDAHAISPRELQMAGLVDRDKSVVTDDFFKSKRILIEGVIRSSEKYLFESTIIELKKRLNFREQLLKIPNAGMTLEYTATYENIEIGSQQGGFGTVRISFLCSDPFGYLGTYTTVLDQASVTTNNTSFQTEIVEGNDEQLPYITLTLDSLTGSGTITVGNLTRGDNLILGGTFTAGDIFIIDAETMTVTQNGTEIDYEGAIPKLNTGINALYYTDDLSARSIDLIVDYRKRYL